MLFADMDAEWLSHTATAFIGIITGAIFGLGGCFFWVRRRQIALRGQEAEQRAKDDANTTQRWRELVDYKSEDFARKNAEQDARVAAMVTKMDEMHQAHLACERKGAEREIEFRKEAAEREIVLMRHEAEIAALKSEMAAIRGLAIQSTNT